MAEAELAYRVAELVGDDTLRIPDAATRWPARAELAVEGAWTPVALYLSTVGRSHRNRDDVERRFQNPASKLPIVDHRPGWESLLLGLWDDDALVDVTRPLLV